LSPLTKLFVILLVLLSMLLSAATVVFVNTTENFKSSLDLTSRQLDAAKVNANRAQADVDAQRQQTQDAERRAQEATNTMRQTANQSQQLIADKDKQLADLSSKMAMQSADLTRVTEALSASESTKSKQSDQIAQLRTTNDTLLKQNGELNLSVSDLSNKLAVTERERSFLAEQLAETKSQGERLGAILRDQGVDPNQVAQVGIRGGAPAINGVIRDTRNIAGVPYATISVGAVDAVKKGMEFNIVNRDTGEFLGRLVVDSVEQNESTGRLAGPKLEQVRIGTEVRTQL
jgi:hypothetical protein